MNKDLSKTNIREYKASDREQIKILMMEFSKFFEPIDPWKRENQDFNAISKHYLDKVFRYIKNRSGIMYVAEIDNVIVGFAATFLRNQTPEEALSTMPMKLGHLESLFVTSKYRNKGIGEMLIKQAEKYFKEKGCTHAELDVFGPNVRAHRLYLKQGYVNDKISMLKAI
ncbi:MAG TPA: GNAT family N-acetyltransferase [Patescibacteria group bacterium]|nr:GNAT family N-acetyltransferase [Patescibacteria group bacterium]